MPKYELMYILSSAVSDNDAPAISNELDKFISENGKLIATENLGKKKLAYPIKKTRNGFYILSTFTAEGGTIGKLENKIRSQENIIRFIVVNLDEQERRQAKDREIQTKMKLSRKPKTEPGTAPAEEAPINLSETELEKKIEQAISSEDLSK
ncbi:MAG: 30S ribosomal protein S6 [Candidatus Doudnabacteria bacterium]|nr:30S ribosomal protein S6 [Candidatus Doudnabacteria bacterium]